MHSSLLSHLPNCPNWKVTSGNITPEIKCSKHKATQIFHHEYYYAFWNSLPPSYYRKINVKVSFNKVQFSEKNIYLLHFSTSHWSIRTHHFNSALLHFPLKFIAVRLSELFTTQKPSRSFHSRHLNFPSFSQLSRNYSHLHFSLSSKLDDK